MTTTNCVRRLMKLLRFSTNIKRLRAVMTPRKRGALLSNKRTERVRRSKHSLIPSASTSADLLLTKRCDGYARIPKVLPFPAYFEPSEHPLALLQHMHIFIHFTALGVSLAAVLTWGAPAAFTDMLRGRFNTSFGFAPREGHVS